VAKKRGEPLNPFTGFEIFVKFNQTGSMTASKRQVMVMTLIKQTTADLPGSQEQHDWNII